ncbi:hypothetical protein PMIN05_007520 [Paraphaeosphaeria minitans]
MTVMPVVMTAIIPIVVTPIAIVPAAVLGVIAVPVPVIRTFIIPPRVIPRKTAPPTMTDGWWPTVVFRPSIVMQMNAPIPLGWAAAPQLLDLRQDRPFIAHQVDVRGNISMHSVGRAAEDTPVRLVPVITFEAAASDSFIPIPVLVACLLPNNLSNVGADIPSTEMVQVPVSFHP